MVLHLCKDNRGYQTFCNGSQQQKIFWWTSYTPNSRVWISLLVRCKIYCSTGLFLGPDVISDATDGSHGFQPESSWVKSTALASHGCCCQWSETRTNLEWCEEFDRLLELSVIKATLFTHHALQHHKTTPVTLVTHTCTQADSGAQLHDTPELITL